MEQLEDSKINLKIFKNYDEVDESDFDNSLDKLLKKEIENDIDGSSTFCNLKLGCETCSKAESKICTKKNLVKSLKLPRYTNNCEPNNSGGKIEDKYVGFKNEPGEDIFLLTYTDEDILPAHLEDALHASISNLKETADICSPHLFKGEICMYESNNANGEDQDELQDGIATNEPHYQRDVCHETGEKSSNYKCDMCNAVFIQYFLLKKHLYKHSRRKAFNISFSRAPFGQKVKKRSNVSAGNDAKRSDLGVHQGRHTSEKAYQCSICLTAFARKDNLYNHSKLHSEEKPYKCKLCPVAFAIKGSLNLHQRLHTGEKPFQCTICLASFAQRAHLNRHQNVHTGEKPFKCHDCCAAFARKSDLKIHQGTHSKAEKNSTFMCFKCDKCSSAFSYRSKLDRHLRVHSADKPFKCTICPAAYACKSGLTSHLIKHTGEKSFKCNFCSKTFARNSHLVRHHTTHTGEKAHKCDFCSHSFATNYHLKRHQVRHTQEKSHKCHFCNCAFAVKALLVEHERIHTGERPYKCCICAATFASLSHLNHHKRRHMEDKPYKCDICKVSYVLKGSLIRHQRMHINMTNGSQ